jgi:hypothetical protein
MIDNNVAKQWFHADAVKACHSVQIHSDEDGNWDGTWTTAEDDIMQDILDKDMGVDVNYHFDGIGNLEETIVSLTAEEASVQTYGDALRIDNQQTGSGPPASLAAAATTGRGGSAV